MTSIDMKLKSNTKARKGKSIALSPSSFDAKNCSALTSPTVSPTTKNSYKDESDLSNPTVTFQKNLDVYRKFRVAVRETEDEIQKHNDRAMRRVQERVMKESLESKIEIESRILNEESHSIKERFIQEADTAKENTDQLHALKHYHYNHIHRLLPLWFKTLNDCTSCIASNGHNNKLEWRSKSRKILSLALQEMNEDESAEFLKTKLRHLSLSINARGAQQVLVELKNIREEYISHKEGGSELGHHTSELRKVKALLAEEKPYPLEKGRWSTDLGSSVSKYKDKAISGLIQHSAYGTGSTVFSANEDNTLNSNSVGNEFVDDGEGQQEFFSASSKCDINYDFSSMDGTDMQTNNPSKLIPSKELLSSQSFFLPNSSSTVDPYKVTDINRVLREASSKGDLHESWRIFSHFYGDYINNVTDKKFLKINLKSTPNLDTFKMLFIAFKNSDSNQYDDISSLLMLMKRVDLHPDLEVFNIILRACERRGAWRRALKYLKKMESDYDIVPSSSSFGIVVDSCRHASDAPAVIFETLRQENLPRKFCYQAAACNAGNRISSVTATDFFIESFQGNSDIDLQELGAANRTVPTEKTSSSAYAPSKKLCQFQDKISKTLSRKSPAYHRTGPTVPAFQSQILKIISPQEKLILANANVKSGAVLGTAGSHADTASAASAVTFESFDDSFAPYKDLNKCSFFKGAELENSVHDTKVTKKKH